MREEALKEWTLESARSHERDSVTCSYTTLIWRSRFKRILQYMYMGSCVTTTASRLVLQWMATCTKMDSRMIFHSRALVQVLKPFPWVIYPDFLSGQVTRVKWKFRVGFVEMNSENGWLSHWGMGSEDVLGKDLNFLAWLGLVLFGIYYHVNGWFFYIHFKV